MEEWQAVAQLKDGDMDGLEMLVNQYYFQALRASFLIIQDIHQAEDIVQTSFLHASEKIEQLSSDRFGPWFLKMVVNASIRAAKRQKRQVSLDDQEDCRFLLEWLTDPHPSIEEIIETEEMRQKVWKALTLLPVRQRAAIVLKYYLQMSEKEVSHELRSPVSSIKWLLFSARNKLKASLRSINDPPFSEIDHSVDSVSDEQEKEYGNEQK
jgi:RNA polymerase sigma-70 factor, ECF subfamily